MSLEFFDCVTCGERVNPVEGFNCVRCASPGTPEAVQGLAKPSDSEENIKHNAQLAASALMALHWASCGGTNAEIFAKAYQALGVIAQKGYPK